MTVSPGQSDVLRDLRQRSYAENGVFWVDDDILAAFDPQKAQTINALNFSDLALPDRLWDLLRGRRGQTVYWRQIRAVWLAQTRRLAAAAELEKLADRMRGLLDERIGSPRDMVWVAQEVISRSLIPAVIDGLERRETARIVRDQMLKIRHNVVTGSPAPSVWTRARSILIQLRAGLVVRRELARRAAGRRPRQLDLTDPVVDLLPELGMGRAVDAVTGVLTAISGPPGGAAACLIYAMARYPHWTVRLREELAPLAPAELYANPGGRAPLTQRFVRETLRLWSPTPVASRPVRKEIAEDGLCLHAGQSYLLSPDILHHDPRLWKDPEVFDPDRWLPGSPNGPRTAGCYAPFGWAPRTCIGAGLGTAQLILLCHLLCTRYHIAWADLDAIAMALPSMPVPQNLEGTLTIV